MTDPAPVAAGELEAFDRACRIAFHEEGRPDEIAHDLKTIEPERTLAIRDGGEIVATAAVLTRTMTAPGGAAVPVAAISAVGTLPGHTRRGHLGRLMRRQLDDVRAAGREPIAALWASEGSLYGRYGYGLASRSVVYELQLPRAALHPDAPRPAQRPRVLEPAAAVAQMAAVYELVRARDPGLLDRSDAYWDRRIFDPEHRREGAGPLRAAVLPGEGYALYAGKPRWSELGPDGEVELRELVAATSEARAALWDHLLHLPLMRKLSWHLAPDHDPLPHLLASTDPLVHKIGHGLFVRLVDVDRALAARTYALPFSVVLEVEDAFCPWNAGRHRLAFDGEAATCEPTSDEPDLALAADALGATYLGGTRLDTLAGAGRVRELRPGALRLAARAFRSDAEPWCPEIF